MQAVSDDPTFQPYGTPADLSSDARDKAIKGLLQEVNILHNKLKLLEEAQGEAEKKDTAFDPEKTDFEQKPYSSSDRN